MEIIKKEMRMMEVIVENYTLCDKCGIKIETRMYDAFEFELDYKTGSAYPEGGSGERWGLDLCPKCAPVAIELLKMNGFKVQATEWDC